MLFSRQLRFAARWLQMPVYYFIAIFSRDAMPPMLPAPRAEIDDAAAAAAPAMPPDATLIALHGS